LSIDVLRLVGLEGALRVLDCKNTEVIICLVQFFQLCGVNLILKFSDSKILNLNGVCNRPFKTNWHWGQLVCVLKHL